ncbi:MAG: NigD-like protein [Prevotellaceae bacterium]|jgi:hypothetical protein|nr:NigD-like protein [Prevotellaceae bacterium]
MKILNRIIIIALVGWNIIGMQSCMNAPEDNDIGANTDIDSYLAMCTLKLLAERDYYFALDNGDKMYPGDTTLILNYPLVDGQRTIVRFLPLTANKPGYKYNVKVIQIENIQSNDIIRLTEENADSIGNDRINVDRAWLSGNYLNIEYLFYQSKSPQQPHRLNMVVSPATTAADANYLNLEFRHNACQDEEVVKNVGLISFRLDSVADAFAGKKGVKVWVNTIYDGKQIYTADKQK